MASKRPSDRVGRLVADVEALAKRLRSDVRKRVKGAGLPKRLQKAANDLRKRAAFAAAQVEKYVHQIRKELEGAPQKAPKRRKPKPKMRASVTVPTVTP
ncbi:MAG TPA: hypothetical protein VMT89_02470 [Candidatus Acidoferrales bacterium]|nr:hypothetical protein [Candidatus Acidoferrales bacterium]